jgi:acetyltransferase-like isoleucine patch superfamily enzyme
VKLAVRRTLRRILKAVIEPVDPLISHPDLVSGIGGASINPTARLYVFPESVVSTSSNHISLGNGVYIGRHAELNADRGSIEIDHDSSIQDFCVLYGDVRVGAHCLFAMHVFVASTSHRFRDRPEWLIRDQDDYFGIRPNEASEPPSRRVHIEDDCWFGWCATVLPGVYIGRGAIIGANCVVTSDVGPYEIHGGAPNRKLSTRLRFDPPASISAVDDSAIPYFYRGFVVTQEGLRRSREFGIVEARKKACLILRGAGGARIRMTGRRFNAASNLRLGIRVNGADYSEHELQPGPFEIKIDERDHQNECKSAIPAPLSGYTCVELETISPSGDRPGYGIATASLLLD